jgi:hypothetical protein
MRWGTLPLLLLTTSGLFAEDRIAFIKFFGYQGIDVQAVRQALPFHEGDALRPEIKDETRSTVQRITGRSATDVDIVCCAGKGDSTVFIGLPGASSHPIQFDPAPQGVTNPPAELTKRYEQLRRAETEALRNAPTEDNKAVGYRLLKEPAARAAELAFHEYAAAREAEILKVLTESGDAAQRAMAADALGFCGRTPRQLAALARAVRDPDADVRNNATRAIFEIARADPSSASQIPPDNFIEMLRSGTWTDRNKGSMALMYVTQARDPVVLSRIQSEAGDALLEIASWSPLGQAMPAVMIRARIAGKSDLFGLLGTLPLSQIGQSAALAAFLSGLLAFAFVRLTSKGRSWALALLAPALISVLLYWVVLRFVGLYILDGPGLAFVFILLPWYLAAAVASCAVVMLRRTGHVHR